MKIFILLTFLPLNLYAETIKGEIFNFDKQYNLVKFSNGRVANAGKTNFEKHVGKTVEVRVTEQNIIEDAKILANRPERVSSIFKLLENTPPPFEPTVLPNLNASQEIFERLNSNYIRRSECSDRAHVWAYDLFKNAGIKSMKVFIFFTASYINKNNFKWWFHVAPLVKVNENNKIVDRVLDYQFMERPATVKEWSDLQVFTKRECKVTTKFSEYDVNPQTEDCYMIYESMYYRLPGDIYAQELKNEYRNSFSETEVKFSEKMGFKKVIDGVRND